MVQPLGIKVTAETAGATANLAILRRELRATHAALSEATKGASFGDELTQEVLDLAEAHARLQSAARDANATLRRGADASAKALKGVHGASAGVTRELVVMGREAGRGNLSRLVGSATILLGRLGILTPVVLGTAAAIGTLVLPIVGFAIAVNQGEQELGRFQGAMEATNGYAGVTISQLQEMARAVADFGHESIAAAKEQMSAIAASGQFSGQTLQLVGEDAARMAQLTGENADKFIEQFSKMKEGVTKFALEYEARYHQLSTAQIEYIRKLEEQGQTEQAEYQLARDVYEYLGSQAPQQLGYLERAWDAVGNAISGAWDNLKGYGRDSSADQIRSLDDQISRLKEYGLIKPSAAGQAVIDNLEKQKKAIEDNEAAQRRAATARSDDARKQSDGAAAAAKLGQAFEESRSSGEKLRAKIAEINAEAAKATAADPAHKALYDKEAAAARAQAEKSDAPAKGRTARGPGLVSQWEEQLHARQIASGEFLKDQTASELAFWQDKLAIVKQGSKDEVAVRGHVYELQKTLARHAYQQQLADDNDKLAADRANWSKEQADWNEKLAFIKGKLGEESADYKNAWREMERAQQQHDAEVQRKAEESANKAYEALKKRLSDAARARDDEARISSTQIEAHRSSVMFGGPAAAAQQGAIQARLIQAQLADLAELKAAKDAQLQNDITNAAGDAEAYKAAIEAKKAADLDFAEQHRALEARNRENSLQTVLAMRDAYHSYIDGVVSSTISGFDGLISGQKTWAQVGIGIYGSVVQAFEQHLQKMVSTWIVDHIFMTAAQRAQIAAQTAATAAGTAAQVSATAAGTATKAKIVSLSNQKEIISHAATAAAGAYHAMAAIPVVGPALGAAAAAATFAAVTAYGELASFDKGTNFIPNDMIAQVHAGERIIPAADNRAIISALNGGNVSNDNRRGGDMHLHMNSTFDRGAPFADQLSQHESNVIAMIANANRRGAFRFA